MARHGVRNAFLPPTALKLMRQAGRPAARPCCARSPAAARRWRGDARLGPRPFGITINEFYGQTECNLVVGNAP